MTCHIYTVPTDAVKSNDSKPEVQATKLDEQVPVQAKLSICGEESLPRKIVKVLASKGAQRLRNPRYNIHTGRPVTMTTKNLGSYDFYAAFKPRMHLSKGEYIDDNSGGAKSKSSMGYVLFVGKTNSPELRETVEKLEKDGWTLRNDTPPGRWAERW
jgi:hypothetical protein